MLGKGLLNNYLKKGVTLFKLNQSVLPLTESATGIVYS